MIGALLELWQNLPLWLQGILKFIAASAVAGGIAAYLTYFERKTIAYIQSRLGPNRAGPFGLLQPIADLLKLLRKEDILPEEADPLLHRTAPYLVFLSAMLALVVVPFGPFLIAGDLNLALAYVIAVSGISVVGLFLAGWGSNSKYSLYGAMRAVAQLVSYEVPIALAFLSVATLAGSLSITGIVRAQQGLWFLIPQFVGFIIFLIAAIAETNRTPFDLPEAESELVAGYVTEYSGMRFGLFFAAEYTMVFVNAALLVTLYLGGWLPPYPVADLAQVPFWQGLFWYWLKIALVIFVFFWVRATLPRLRVDQLMEFCWKVLVPVGMLNLIWSALLARAWTLAR